MKDSFFAGALIVAGAILIAATEISNGSIGMFLGLPLIVWGIAERIVILIKSNKRNKFAIQSAYHYCKFSTFSTSFMRHSDY